MTTESLTKYHRQERRLKEREENSRYRNRKTVYENKNNKNNPTEIINNYENKLRLQ